MRSSVRRGSVSDSCCTGAPNASAAAGALNRIITDGLEDLNEAEDFPRPHSLSDPQSLFPYACLGPAAVSVNQLVIECDISADERWPAARLV
jgi:hypothetical protein